MRRLVVTIVALLLFRQLIFGTAGTRHSNYPRTQLGTGHTSANAQTSARAHHLSQATVVSASQALPSQVAAMPAAVAAAAPPPPPSPPVPATVGQRLHQGLNIARSTGVSSLLKQPVPFMGIVPKVTELPAAMRDDAFPDDFDAEVSCWKIIDVAIAMLQAH